MEANTLESNNSNNTGDSTAESDQCCPVCSSALIQEKCKVVCRSEQCVYRIVFNCSEF